MTAFWTQAQDLGRPITVIILHKYPDLVSVLVWSVFLHAFHNTVISIVIGYYYFIIKYPLLLKGPMEKLSIVGVNTFK